ncbi:MAG: hypothetical protein IIC22_09140, partial [Chloroflexi bacterium]|nr:hypothetical protein [Chloroflexota bacterium]
RVIDLPRMSSGLKFSGMAEPRENWEHGVADHLMGYSEAIDVFDFSISRPLEHPPNTVGRYRNCDPLTLGYIIKQIVVDKLGEEYLTWPQRALFDRIGIRRQVMETDTFGNFILTGYDYGTARNWARIALLYLQDGVWNGERILPEGLRAEIDRDSWTAGPVFDWLRELGDGDPEEMARVFNMGIGLALVVSPFFADSIRKQLRQSGLKSWRIGRVLAGPRGVGWA